MKIYVASGLANHRLVLDLEDQLRALGHEITFSWAEKHKEELFTNTPTPDIGELCVQGVKNSDLVILITHGGRGTHIEYGIALGLGKRVIMWFHQEPKPTTMYLSPVVRTRQELLAMI